MLNSVLGSLGMPSAYSSILHEGALNFFGRPIGLSLNPPTPSQGATFVGLQPLHAPSEPGVFLRGLGGSFKAGEGIFYMEP